MNWPDTLTLALFLTLLVLVLSAVLSGIYFANKEAFGRNHLRPTLLWSGGILFYLSVFSLWVRSGYAVENPIPGLPITFAAILLASGLFALSPQGRRLSDILPLSALVLFQGFRFPLELILHSWVEQKTVPYTMTWNADNFDIWSGILAIGLTPLVTRHRLWPWIANAVGIALLVNVMRVVILSSPLPFAWELDQPLTLIFHWPLALIGPIAVGGALAGHIVLTRALLRRST
ncbi:MAG: hypothetical protein AB7F86_10995 [Bdellovibrionales bacterium]